MKNKSFNEDKIIEIIVIPAIIVFALFVWWLVEASHIEPEEETTVYYGEFIGDEIMTEPIVENSVESVENITVETTKEETTKLETTTKLSYIEREMIITAYCPCEICCGKYALDRPKDENGKDIVYTASGKRAKSGVTIAVDPRYIPYGTEVIIDGMGTYIAEDCGGAIKGNRIDVYFDEHQKALDFVYPHGKLVKNVKVML